MHRLQPDGEEEQEEEVHLFPPGVVSPSHAEELFLLLQVTVPNETHLANN